MGRQEQPGSAGASAGASSCTLASVPRAWLVAGAVVSVALCTAMPFLKGAMRLDFSVYLLGGAHAFGSELYQLHLPHTGLPFTYPPFAAVLFAPLAALPPGLPIALWSAAGTACVVALIAVSLRAASPRTDPATAWLLGAIACAPALALRPLYETLAFGQINCLIVTMVLADLTLDLRIGRHRLPRGVLVGLAAAIKLTPALFVVYLVVTKQLRAARTAVVSFLAATLFAACVAPQGSWTFWTHDVFRDRSGPAYYISDQNLAGLLDRFRHVPVGSSTLWSAEALVGAAGLGVAVLAYRRSSQLLGVLVCAATALAVSPVTWDHHYVWIIPLVAWLALAADRPAAGRWIAAAVVVLFVAAPIWWMPHSHLRELHERLGQFVLANAFVLADLAFITAVGIGLARRSPGVPAGPEPAITTGSALRSGPGRRSRGAPHR
jgi:alpha-1,2-mannosyltransferase